MIEFAGRSIPDDDDQLTELIRQEAHRAVIWEDRDDRPPSPIDWVSELLRAHPELIARIEAVYSRLLAGADPIEVREVLEQAAGHSGDMAALLVGSIADHGDALEAQPDSTNDTRSLLGAVVEKLSSIARPPRLTPRAVERLAAIDKPADGWPTSLRMALAADFDAHRQLLVPALQKLVGDDEAMMGFVRGFVNAGPPLTDRGLEEIGRGPAALRAEVGAAVKRFLDEAEASRQLLLDPKILAKYPPEIRRKLEAQRPDPWPDYAARLKIQA